MAFTIHLPARALTLMQAACLFCDKKSVYLQFRSVYLIPKDNGLQIAATDGSAAFIGRIDTVGELPEDACPVIVLSAELEAAVKALKKAEEADIWLTAGENMEVSLRAGDFAVTATSFCSSPLDFERVAFHAHNEPKGLSDVPVVNVAYLETVAKAAKILQKGSRSYDEKRVLLRSETGGSINQCFALDRDAIALVMGMRQQDYYPDYERTRAAIFGGL